MRIPADAIIAWEKLVDYLLQPRIKDDKSQFLAALGFVASNPLDLESAIRSSVADTEASSDGWTEYGTFWVVHAPLIGSEGQRVVTFVWIQRSDGGWHFVTLYPHRGSAR